MAAKQTKLKFSPEVESYIDLAVTSRRYRSREALIEHAVGMLADYEMEVAELRASLAQGERDIAAGKGIPASQMTVARIRALSQQTRNFKKKAS